MSLYDDARIPVQTFLVGLRRRTWLTLHADDWVECLCGCKEVFPYSEMKKCYDSRLDCVGMYLHDTS